jgi:hypothetical protein
MGASGLCRTPLPRRENIRGAIRLSEEGARFECQMQYKAESTCSAGVFPRGDRSQCVLIPALRFSLTTGLPLPCGA